MKEVGTVILAAFGSAAFIAILITLAVIFQKKLHKRDMDDDKKPHASQPRTWSSTFLGIQQSLYVSQETTTRSLYWSKKEKETIISELKKNYPTKPIPSLVISEPKERQHEEVYSVNWQTNIIQGTEPASFLAEETSTGDCQC